MVYPTKETQLPHEDRPQYNPKPLNLQRPRNYNYHSKKTNDLSKKTLLIHAPQSSVGWLPDTDTFFLDIKHSPINNHLEPKYPQDFRLATYATNALKRNDAPNREDSCVLPGDPPTALCLPLRSGRCLPRLDGQSSKSLALIFHLFSSRRAICRSRWQSLSSVITMRALPALLGRDP